MSGILTGRSDVSNPDMHDFLALLTCFPTLPVIGMFKNEMLPIPGVQLKGSCSEDDEDSVLVLDKENPNAEEDELIEFDENNDNNNDIDLEGKASVLDFEDVRDEEEPSFRASRSERILLSESRDEDATEKNGIKHMDRELSLSMSFDNADTDEQEEAATITLESTRHETEQIDHDSTHSPPSRSNTVLRRSSTSPSICSTASRSGEFGIHRMNSGSGGNSTEGTEARDTVPLRAQTSFDSDGSGRAFLSQRQTRAQSFNGTSGSMLRRHHSGSPKRQRGGGKSMEFDVIKAKEFEVARANAKCKRIKRKILRWMQVL